MGPTAENYKDTAEQMENKYKSYSDLELAIRQQDIRSTQVVIGFDFSESNEWTGKNSYGRHLHGTDYINPYLKALKVLQPIIRNFDDDQIYPAFRFGCVDSKDQKVISLGYPEKYDPNFEGFDSLIDYYFNCIQTVKMSGPTTFAPIIRQTIEIYKSYKKKQLVFLLILTNGDVNDIELDKAAIVEASNYPISICAIGLGDGPFDKMVYFDDFKETRKFDNFQFVNFTAIEKQLQDSDDPELYLACHVFNEFPEHIENMKKLGLL